MLLITCSLLLLIIINYNNGFIKKFNKKITIYNLYNKKLNNLVNEVHKLEEELTKNIYTVVWKKNKITEKHVWFTVPEYIFGEPIYDQGDCIGYLVKNLQDNGFDVRYVHPNTLFISWANWIPAYVRNEIKKKTGKIIDEKGNIIDKEGEHDENDPNSKIFNDKNANNLQKGKKEYTPINQYKPTGNLVYNPEMFEKLEKKMT
jgi:hypothetical protein